MKLLRIIGLVMFFLTSAAFAWYRVFQTSSIDTVPPVITFTNNSITTSVSTPKEELLKGVSAFDQKDKDVTSEVVLEKMSGITNGGKRTITYAVSDSSYNVAEKERELIYSDYTPPRFSLTKPLIFVIGTDVDVKRYLTVADCFDGDLTDKIRFEEPDVYFGESETSYNINYIVTNSAGDTATLPVTVDFRYPDYDKDKTPQISLSQYIVYIKAKAYFDEKSYLDSVSIGDNQYILKDGLQNGLGGNEISKNMITVQSNVNLREAGTYEVRYSLTTQDSYTGYTKLIVVVEE